MGCSQTRYSELSICIFTTIGSRTSYDCGIRVSSISHGKAAQQPRHTNARIMAALASLPPCCLAVRPLGTWRHR
eukprot:6213835-Pleurochrysis_carterae.AAC.3